MDRPLDSPSAVAVGDDPGSPSARGRDLAAPVGEAAIQALRAGFAGEVLVPGDAGYDPDNVFRLNHNIEPR